MREQKRLPRPLNPSFIMRNINAWLHGKTQVAGVDRTSTAPRNTWTTHIGRFRLVVHRHIDYDPDQWLASCHPSVLDKVPLASKDIAEAKCQAVAKLQVICEEAIRDIVEQTVVKG